MLYNLSSMYLCVVVAIANSRLSVVVLGVVSEVLGIGRHIPCIYACKVVVDSIKVFLILNPNEGGCMVEARGVKKVHTITYDEVMANTMRRVMCSSNDTTVSESIHRVTLDEVSMNKACYAAGVARMGEVDVLEEVDVEYSSLDSWNPTTETIVVKAYTEYEIYNNYNTFTVQDMVKEGVLS